MKKIFLFVLLIWPFIAFAYGQQNQTLEVITNESELPLELTESLDENVILIKQVNDFWPNTLLDIVLIISGITSMGLVVILWHQSRQTETSQKLSYGPVIHGRFNVGSGFPKLIIDNVGKGPALDLYLDIKTPDGKIILDTVKRLALTPDDKTHSTTVDLSKHPQVLLHGTYKDANRKLQKIHHMIDFPLMRKADEDDE